MDLAGFKYLPNFLTVEAQKTLLSCVRSVVSDAPLFQPTMPRTGKPLSVEMSNCGDLGWVSDIKGYRYQSAHPNTGLAWPAMPEELMTLWKTLLPDAPKPEACLVNYYKQGTRMGLHRDQDEENFEAPVLSVSLGDTATFRLGGLTRKSPTQSFPLRSGDIVILGGDARRAYHGVDRILTGSSTLLKNGGRINLTLRRVTIF